MSYTSARKELTKVYSDLANLQSDLFVDNPENAKTLGEIMANFYKAIFELDEFVNNLADDLRRKK